MSAVIDIFIPAYNAEKRLPGVIERIPAQAWAMTRSLWIINDGSTDATESVAREIARARPVVRTIRFERNRGYGSAVKAGLAAARRSGADYAVCLHADGQYPPEGIPEMISLAREKGLDVLQGSRLSGKGALSGGMPLYKFLAGKTLTFLENRVFGLSMTDYHSGFLCYSRRALNTVRFESLSGSFDIDLEIIAVSRRAGLRIGEMAIPACYAGEVSYLNPVAYGFRVIGVMMKYLSGRYKACAASC